uniref:Palmitoyltransferase n=1 Tax=Alexandrium monilatum TaxID=311494 RepID=A0A7S4W2V5_9DINO|mmetsp:Transcript_53476/g.168351  ORF Transcript_53476/g.168351 Transcript_53476/m.168351 type:complete len:329 (+) Transcript_53476:70-1056(+)
MTQHKFYGNNKVFCRGRLISGPDIRSCAASVLMIAVPSTIWHIEVGMWYAERYTIVISAVIGLMQAASLVLLICTAFSDPGIMPRQKDFQEQYDAKTRTFRAKQPPRYFEVLVRGHPFKLKYCTTCNIYRPPRCVHCSVCENCIERFDHHCPWIGNCIGKRNYWLFYSFVSFTGAVNAAVLATSAAQLGLLTREIMNSDSEIGGGDALVKALGQEPLSATVVVYCTAIVWFTVGLCLYHNYLVCTNQTTYEQIKGAYSGDNNPFHRGAAGNCQDILCSRVRPRYFNPFTGKLLWPTSDPAFAPSNSPAAAPLARAAPPAGEAVADGPS